MKKSLVVLGVALLCASMAAAQAPLMTGTRHDLSVVTNSTDEICVFCHTPHGSNVSAPRATNELPLWNHTLPSPASTYLVYDSVTMEIHPNVAGQYEDFSSADNASSALCMSCHDGTVAVHDLINGPGTGDPALTMDSPALRNLLATGEIDPTAFSYLGTDLQNDHPVNIDYTVVEASDLEIRPSAGGTVTNAGNTVQLFNNKVQCASCHDPHSTQAMLLTVSNSQSQLCAVCHVK